MDLVVRPLPQCLGATVEGVDLSDGIDDAVVDELRRAWHQNLVLFFPRLCLTDEQHVALGSVFGDLAATSRSGDDYREQSVRGPNGEILVLDSAVQRANGWHTDVTFTARPPIGSLLSMQVCPPRGGDTMWSNQYDAYDALSVPIKTMLEGLTATHGRAGLTGTSVHPLVINHPETRQRALFVNRGWTSRIEGMSSTESAGILAMLFTHCERPEFTVRWTWAAGDAALWDNRCTMHYALDDYGDHARVIHRVTIYDPADTPEVSASATSCMC